MDENNGFNSENFNYPDDKEDKGSEGINLNPDSEGIGLNNTPAPGTGFTTPAGGQYVNFPDGTRRYVPNGAYYEPPKEEKKKKKGGIIAASIIAGVLFLSLIGVFTYYSASTLVDSINNSSSAPAVGDVSDTAEESIYEDLSIPEYVQVAPVPDENYDSLAELYQKCSGSCVTIICDVEINNGFYTQEGRSLGSGFIIEGEKDGEKGYYIVTNHHVIDDAKSITVKYSDGKTYDAKLLGSDELCDIAVLKTDRTDVTPIEIGDSSKLAVGQWVVAIGTPSAEELQNTMTYGIISGLNRKVPMTNDVGTVVKTMTVIQTSATINPGNSGGPLINMAGQVVGITAMKLMDEYEGIGFALPSSEASTIINSLIEYGRVVDGSGSSFVTGTAQLGITGQTVTDDVRDTYSLGDCPDGVLVVNVTRGTAAYEAGLSIYDVITEFDGEEVDTIEGLKELISQHNAGDKVTLKYYRIGRRGEESGYHSITFKLDSAQ